MRVYKSEKEAGISFETNENGHSSAFVTAPIQIKNSEEYFDGMPVLELLKSNSTVQSIEELIGQDQPDLALVVAILVSTGWNLNDDVFTPEETWKARNTPLHKPMNDNHKDDRILGHIVQARVLDKSGNLIETENVPSEFDIEVAGVLYRACPTLAKRINDIITKAQTGEMFVSMEAWFPDFGYGLKSSNGEVKLIERNEKTAFLTKHLRIYGGTGEYQGYKLGRVLKDIIFGAQGFVDEPANPESVIKVAAKKDNAPKFVTAKLEELEGGVNMDEKQIKELQEKLEKTQADLESKTKEVDDLKKEMGDFKSKDYEGQIATLTEKVEKLTNDVSEASEKTKAVEVEKTDLQKQFDEMKVRAEKSEAELDEIRKNEMARERLAKLTEAKEIKDEEATLAELRAMTQETFDAVLKYAGEAKAEGSEEKVDENKEETDENHAEAALDNAEEKEEADLNATDEKSEEDGWTSMAMALCKRDENEDKGGE